MRVIEKKKIPDAKFFSQRERLVKFLLSLLVTFRFNNRGQMNRWVDNSSKSVSEDPEIPGGDQVNPLVSFVSVSKICS